jgi:capsular polysaccharide biosynthesis protein
VSLSFIGAAIHRRVPVWVSAAVAGLVFGAALFVLAPPAYQASTSLILTHDVSQNPTDAMQTDVALAQTRAVAGAVVRQLGLKESVSKFLSSYTVAATTDRIMTITLSAPASDDAVSQANALAAAFLRFRASRLTEQQGLVIQSLKQEVSAAQQQVAADNTALSQAKALPPSKDQRNAVSDAQTKLATDTKTAVGLKDSVTDYPTTTEQEIQGSYAYDRAALLPRSRLRVPLQYAFGGLLLGLVVGLGIVIVGALASDRLRRRDDIARALGAPVRLSDTGWPARGPARPGGWQGP